MDREIDSRLETRLPHLLIDTTPTTIHRPVLSRHNRLQRRLVLHVSRERRQLWDDDDDLVKEGWDGGGAGGGKGVQHVSVGGARWRHGHVGGCVRGERRCDGTLNFCPA